MITAILNVHSQLAGDIFQIFLWVFERLNKPFLQFLKGLVAAAPYTIKLLGCAIVGMTQIAVPEVVNSIGTFLLLLAKYCRK